MWRRLAFLPALILIAATHAQSKPPLPGTEPLTWNDDIASRMVAGIDRFLLRETEKSTDGRGKFWKRDFSSAQNYNKSIESNRQHLAQILGVRDQRVNFDAPELVATVNRPALLLETERYSVYAIRWPAVWRGTAFIPSAICVIVRIRYDHQRSPVICHRASPTGLTPRGDAARHAARANASRPSPCTRCRSDAE